MCKDSEKFFLLTLGIFRKALYSKDSDPLLVQVYIPAVRKFISKLKPHLIQVLLQPKGKLEKD